MSKENMKKFLEKAAADPVLAEKLEAQKEVYVEKLITLAQETGFQISPDDFVEDRKPLSDDAVDNVSGGWSPSPFGHYCSIHGVD